MGVFVKYRDIDRDLERDVYWFDGLWSRCAAHALAARSEENEPSLRENLEPLFSIKNS